MGPEVQLKSTKGPVRSGACLPAGAWAACPSSGHGPGSRGHAVHACSGTCWEAQARPSRRLRDSHSPTLNHSLCSKTNRRICRPQRLGGVQTWPTHQRRVTGLSVSSGKWGYLFHCADRVGGSLVTSIQGPRQGQLTLGPLGRGKAGWTGPEATQKALQGPSAPPRAH